MDCNKEDAIRAKSIAESRIQKNDFEGTNFSGMSFNPTALQSHSATPKKHPGPGVSRRAAMSRLAHFSGLDHDQMSLFSSAGTWKKCFDRFLAHDLRTQDEPANENSAKDGNDVLLTGTKGDFFNASIMNFQRAKSDDPEIYQEESKLECSQYFDKSKDNISYGKVNDDLIHCKHIEFKNLKLQPTHYGEEEEKRPTSQNRSRKKVNRTKEQSGSKLTRRSDRLKQNVAAEEIPDASIDSRSTSKRRRKGRKQVTQTEQTNNDVPSVIADGNKLENVFPTRCETSVDDPEYVLYPEAEFYDFDSERCEGKFAVGQIWALYDNGDGMPRLYARVRKVYSRRLKLQLSWLDWVPVSAAEIKWAEQNLPISCGIYKLRKDFFNPEQQMLSHLVTWSTGLRRNSYVIYPRKGEIWALFCDWDLGWSSEPNPHRVYQYQVVEIVSDFTEVGRITAVRLVKLKEFMALFVRAADTEACLLEIEANDVLMFSHRVPACRMKGKKGGVPKGSFELDCASLPANFRDTCPSISIESTKSRTPIQQNASKKSRSGTWDSSFKKMTFNSNVGQHIALNSQIDAERGIPNLINKFVAEADNIHSQNPNTEHPDAHPVLPLFRYPESEFYDFDSDRLMEKFECGQIWALYCKIDSFPKCYGRIRWVVREKNQVLVSLLRGLEEDHCDDDKPPPACGVFEVVNETCRMDSGETFSHLVMAKAMEIMDHYYIFPAVGEIWAAFSGCYAFEPRNTEYDIFEISASDASGTKALLLTKVDGYISVFKRKNEGSDTIKLFPTYECWRFSHRIPAYQLTKKMGSSCSWELDPAAVPSAFFASKP